MKSKYFILLSIVLLSEMKALFYYTNKKVSWYLFSDKKRYLCNVVEDYSNILIFGIVFYFMAFVKIDSNLRKICLFLFILNALDLIHLGLMDMQYMVALKLVLTYVIYRFWLKLRAF